MKTRRGFLALQCTIIAVFLGLNALLFYIINCSGEYLQSRDIWGNTQTILHTDLRNRQRLLTELSGKGTDAVAEIDRILNQMELSEKEAKDAKEGNEANNQTSVQATMMSGAENKENYLAVRDIFLEASSFQEDVQDIGEKAKSMAQTALYNEGWLLNNTAKSERDYYGLNYVTVWPVQDDAWNALINFRVSDLLAVTMAVTGAVFLFYFWQNQTERMLPGTQGILVIGSLILLTGFAGIYAGNLLMKELFLERSRFDISLQSLHAFRNCPYMINIGGFFLLWLGIKLSACFLFFITVLCLLSCEKKKRRLLGAALLLVVLLEFILSRYEREAPVLVLLREVNLLSAFSTERFFNRYLNLNLAGSAHSRLAFFLVFWCMVFGTVLLVCIRKLGAYHRAAQKQVQQTYYEEINRQYIETRRLWHDFQNHLLTIQALNENGDREGADRYVKELNENISRNKLAPKTGCSPVDLLLYKKQELAEEQAITLRLTIQCRLDEMKFAAYDLCSVIGNLLDNSFEAVAVLSQENRIVELELKQQQGMLLISCKNPYQGELIRENGRYITTKKEKEGHGIGLSSVRQVCKKYQGTWKWGQTMLCFRFIYF